MNCNCDRSEKIARTSSVAYSAPKMSESIGLTLIAGSQRSNVQKDGFILALQHDVENELARRARIPRARDQGGPAHDRNGNQQWVGGVERLAGKIDPHDESL